MKKLILNLLVIFLGFTLFSVNAQQTGSPNDDVYVATRYSNAQIIKTTTSNNVYVLRDYTRGSGIETYNIQNSRYLSNAIDFTDDNNQWTAEEHHNNAKDDAALDAHYATEKAWDYFMIKHGRNSFDGNGAIIKNYVHFNFVQDGFSDNDHAMWTGSEFRFGDGTNYDAHTSLDIVVHEFGQAVCDYTANLDDNGESGALREGFADIWASCIEYYANPEKETWLIGEDIGNPIRSMENPKNFGQPDTYKGTYWSGTPKTNAGVLNFWFYILCEGDTGTNDNGFAYTVSGIGIEKAERIVYRTEKTYLNSNSDFADARLASVQATKDLYGVNSNEVTQVEDAWDAVGVADSGGSPVADAPSSPTNLQSNTITETSVNLTWNASTSSTGIAGYKVFKDGVEVRTVSSTNTTINGLSEQTTYNFYVKAYDMSDEISGASNTVNVTTAGGDTEKPTIPQNLTASNVGETSVQLAWDASTDNVAVEKYKIYKNGAFYAYVTSTSSLITGLTPGVDYNFRVRAYDLSGNSSSYSNYVYVTTTSSTDTEAPTAPTNLSSSDIGETSIKLTWDASTDNVAVEKYKVYRSNAKGPSVTITEATSTTTLITGLNPNSRYKFYVKAVDPSGNTSSKSNYIYVTTLSYEDTEAPTKPTNLSSFDIGKTSVKLTWDASTDNVAVEKYQVYKSNAKNAKLGSALEVTSTTALITGLNPGSRYQFYVYAVDPSGNRSSRSSSIYVTTKTDEDAEAPTTPANLTVFSVGETDAVLQWDASTDNINVEKYIVYNVEGGISTAIQEVTSTSAFITGLTPGTTYSYKVQAEDPTGNNSGFSNTVNLTTESVLDTEAPTAPENLVETFISSSEIRIRWDASTDNVAIKKYIVYVDGSLHSYTTDTTATITGLLPLTLYKFYVIAEDNSGNKSEKSNTISVTTLEQSYCNSYGRSQADEWIDYVELGSIVNTTGGHNGGGYHDYTESFTPESLSANSTNTIYYSIGYNGTHYHECFNIWIDYNRNGDFTDAGELVVHRGSLNDPGTYSSQFTVPATIVSGPTRMRVSMKFSSFSASCEENFGYGEVEDYPINLGSSKSATKEVGNKNINDIFVTSELKLYPNPALSYIIADFTSQDNKPYQINIYSITGSLVKTKIISVRDTKIDVSDLVTGVYTVVIRTNTETINSKFVKQ